MAGCPSCRQPYQLLNANHRFHVQINAQGCQSCGLLQVNRIIKLSVGDCLATTPIRSCALKFWVFHKTYNIGVPNDIKIV